MKQHLKNIIIFVILLIAGFLLPSFGSNQFKSYAAIGSYCNAAGHAGTCQNRSTTYCSGYYDSGGWCPYDPNSVQCCVPAPVYCASPYTSNQCHNSSSGGYGNTFNCGAIGGTFNSGGYCPGPNDVQCCVVNTPPPPTNVYATCTTSGIKSTVTLNWTLPAGYSYAYGRIHDAAGNVVCNDAGPFVGTSLKCTTAIPGHTYNSWAHTTNSAGSPYSTAVNAAPITCPAVPACPNNPAPQGTIVSTGVAATASNNTANTKYANDGIGAGVGAQYWDSGGTGPQYIEFDLGASQQISGIQLIAHTGGAATTNQTTQINAGTATNPSTVAVPAFTCAPTDGQVINLPITQSNVQYIRVNASESTNNVGWYEVSVFGSSPGSQTTTPGIIFSGDKNPAFGQGAASTLNWSVGGLTYSEIFKVNRTINTPTENVKSVTSYKYVLNKAHTAQISITPMPDITDSSGNHTCSTPSTSCTLPANLPNGVYQADGNVMLNAYTFPANKNYIFLINGDLNILGSLIVPNGSTAFFTSSNDIIVDKNVGTATNLFPLPAGQVQGIFSADRDFRIMGIDRGSSSDCTLGKDKMLNIEGAIVTNALGNGGNFRWQRDLCGDNPRYPTFTIRARLDMLLNLPEILMQRTTTFREDAP